MESLEMDEIAAFRCAIRSGCNVRKPSDVTDKMKVKMARKKSLDVAKYILVECHLRTYDVDEEDGEQHSFVKLLHELAYGLIPASNLKEWAWISLFPEGTNFVSKYSEKLGEEYTEYLTQCFTDANTGYERYIVDAAESVLMNMKYRTGSHKPSTFGKMRTLVSPLTLNGTPTFSMGWSMFLRR